MKITKSMLRILFAGALAGIILATLFPGLTDLKVMLFVFAIVGLFELVRADFRADICAQIRADVEREHEDTRVWLRDWFDPGHTHSVNVNVNK